MGSEISSAPPSRSHGGAIARAAATLRVAVERLLAQPALTLLSLVGLILPVALVMSIPLYAANIYRRTLIERISETEAAYHTASLFDFVFEYNGGYGTRAWGDIQPVDAYITGSAGAQIGLPYTSTSRVFLTQAFALYPGEAEILADTPPAWGQFAYVGGIEAHLTLVEGQLWGATVPAHQDNTQQDEAEEIEILVSSAQANAQGLQAGDRLTLVTADGGRRIPVRISGIWQPTDPESSFWFIQPGAMEDWLLVSEPAFTGDLDRRLGTPVYMGWWFLPVDASRITTDDVNPLIERIAAVHRHVRALRPEMDMSSLPLQVLETYQQSARVLTFLLALYSLPVVGLLLVFVVLTALLVTERQRNEIAVLRSRGASRAQVMGLVGWEALVLGAFTLLLGLPVSLLLARSVGRARSFLDFSGAGDLAVSLTRITVALGGLTLIFGVLCRLLPVYRAAENTIVDYKQERARVPRRPWWQRMGLDLLLLVAAAYGAYLLRSQGTLGILDPLRSRNPFQNPLLFLVPALGTLAVTLLFLRVMPLLLSAIAWVASATRSVGLLSAGRHLARTPSTYVVPILLLVMTLSLAIYTATLAGTLDRDLHDRAYYKIGADMMFLDIGEGGPDVTPSDFRGERQVTLGAPSELTQPWRFPPVFVYLDLPGVKDVARVGRYAATLRDATPSGSTYASGTFLGVDPGDFVRVAFWREDFAQRSLGELMTRLGARADGLLLPCSMMGFHAPGDLVQLSVYTYQRTDAVDFTLVGCFDLFPTWYPDPESPGTSALFVANLDYLYTTIGQTYPFEVWLALDRGLDAVDISNTPIGGVNLYKRGWGWDAPKLDIHTVQEEPRRQGLLGLLSVGFITAAGLSVAGFILHLLFSFRQRFIEFGVLRAVGLSVRQMTGVLVWEVAILLLTSGALGTALGIVVSRAFIPYLQVGTLGQSTIPPYVVAIDWSATIGVYAVFAALFVLALGLLVILLRRLRIFEALKLGETL